MPLIHEKSTAVVVANEMNLSIFKPHWFINNQILESQELTGDTIISPPAIKIGTPRYELSIFPNRIQMTFTPPHDEAYNDLHRVAGGIVETLPHTPYSAVGLNFDYYVTFEEEQDFASWTRSCFESPVSKLILSEKNTDAHYGTYFSCNMHGARLKLKCTPMEIKSASGTMAEQFKGVHYAVHLNFNHHYELPESDVVNTIKSCLDYWNTVYESAEAIANQIKDYQ